VFNDILRLDYQRFNWSRAKLEKIRIKPPNKSQNDWPDNPKKCPVGNKKHFLTKNFPKTLANSKIMPTFATQTTKRGTKRGTTAFVNRK